MPTQDQELASAVVRMKKTGELVQDIDGTETVVARYSKTTGHLEFETKEASVKLYQQVIAKIGTVAKGTQPSGNVIRTMGVKGEAPTKLAANTPKRPRMGPLGDLTPEVVEWFFKYDLPQAIVRYGVFTDDRGEPVRKDARRLVKQIVDRRDEDDRDLKAQRSGPKSETKGPVTEESEMVMEKNAIIARRATHMTFTPREAIGGFDTGDDDILPDVGADEGGGE